MQCSAGTVCSPSGHTDVFKVDYENSQNGQAPTTNGASTGITATRSASVAGIVLGLWMLF